MRRSSPSRFLMFSLSAMFFFTSGAVFAQVDPDDGNGGAVWVEGDEYDQEETYPEQEYGAQPGTEAQGDVDASYFFDKLAPYGEWIWTPEYGWVWKPQGTWPGWRPYTYGYWTLTTEGWTWTSSFVWGWAPFHYGNWVVMDGLGWVWVPGTVWAPAWVMWRHSDAYIGWAPLLPGFDTWYGWAYFPVYYSHWTFLDWGHFGHREPHHHYLSRKKTRDTFRHTYFPRDCRSRAGSDCVRGPKVDVVRQHSKLDTTPRKINNLARDGRLVKPDRAKLGLGGDELKIFRPTPRRTGPGGKLQGIGSRSLPGSATRSVDLGIVNNTRPRVIDIEAVKEREAQGFPQRPGQGATISPERPGRHLPSSSPSMQRRPGISPFSRDMAPSNVVPNHAGPLPGAGVGSGSRPSFTPPKVHSGTRPSFSAPKGHSGTRPSFSAPSSSSRVAPSRSSSSSTRSNSFSPRSSSSKSSSSKSSSSGSSGKSSSSSSSSSSSKSSSSGSRKR